MEKVAQILAVTPDIDVALMEEQKQKVQMEKVVPVIAQDIGMDAVLIR
jgi:hypothetical protein